MDFPLRSELLRALRAAFARDLKAFRDVLDEINPDDPLAEHLDSGSPVHVLAHGIDLLVRHGHLEAVATWSRLADAAPLYEDDLFALAARAGLPLDALPAPAPRPLPGTPYKDLAPYTADDALIFFGRREWIKTILKKLRDPAPPIVIVHGPSGVGKSSLLQAGVLPRGGGDFHGLYVSHSTGGSLRGSLATALGGVDIAAEWAAREQKLGVPLVVVLDQVESAYTTAGNDARGDSELVELLAALPGRGGAPAVRGKLVLGIRKEWLSDALRPFEAEGVDLARIEIPRIDEASIREIILGPTRRGLAETYHLSFEPVVVDMIVADLLADTRSPIAPTLQVLLSQLSREAPVGPDGQHITLKQYQLLGHKEERFKAFIQQRLQALDVPALKPRVDAGLALDLLFTCTTEARTASTIAEATLAANYGPDIHALIDACENQRLLRREFVKDDTKPTMVSLTHDSVAPVVRRLFRESTLPAQKARRLLARLTEAHKDTDANNPTIPRVDVADLVTLEQGQPGMRVMPDLERRIIADNRDRLDREQADRDKALARQRRAEQELADAKFRAAEQQRIAAQELADAELKAARELAEADAKAAERQRIAELTAARALADANAKAAEQQRIADLKAAQLRADDNAKAAEQQRIADLKAAQLLADAEVKAARKLVEANAKAAEQRRIADQKLADAKLKSTRKLLLRVGLAGAVAGLAALGAAWQYLAAEDAATHARDQTRMVALREAADDPTIQAALLREVERPENTRRWQQSITEIRHAAPAVAVLEHDSAVTSAAFSPEGERILTVSRDDTALLWPTDGSGAPIQFGSRGTAEAAAFSSDGRQIITVGQHSARIWPSDGSNEPFTFTDPSLHSVRSVAVSPDGGRVGIITKEFAVLWYADGTDKNMKFSFNDTWFSPDLERIAGGSPLSNSVQVTRTTRGGASVLLEGSEEFNNALKVVAFSPDGSRIVTASTNGETWIWRSDGSGKPMRIDHKVRVKTASFSHDGRWIVTVANDDVARVWLSEIGKLYLERTSRGQDIKDAALSPNGDRIAVVIGSTARVWRTDGKEEDFIVLSGHTSGIDTLVFSPNGRRILTASQDGTARVWRVDALDDDVVFDDIGSNRSSAWFSAAQGRVVTLGSANDPQIRSIDGAGSPMALITQDHRRSVRASAPASPTSPPDERIETLDDNIESAAFSPDGDRIVTVSYAGIVQVWPADHAGPPITLEGRIKAESARFSPDGRYVVSRYYLCRADGKQAQIKLQHNDRVPIDFSPDGTSVVTVSSRDKTAVLQWLDNKQSPELLAHASRVRSARFSPDGTRIVTASAETANIWSSNGNFCLRRSPQHPSSVKHGSRQMESTYY